MDNNKKKKILMISDHPLSISGVGCQSRFLVNGLINTGKYTFRSLGCAKRHKNYETIKVNEDFVIKPIDGFGNPELIRYLLFTERPDAILIFNDPRFFMYLFEMEDEVHQQCPILYNKIWDEFPFPKYNMPIYESVDLLNCISHLTYNMLKDNLPENQKHKVNFTPHFFPQDMYYPLDNVTRQEAKVKMIGEDKKDWFVGLWTNRNAKRKRPSDLMWSWKKFIDKLEKEEGHRKAILILHTDPLDMEGPNLYEVVDMLGIADNICFSTSAIEFAQMNVLHNISDFYVNISFNEGWGLGTTISLQCGIPIVSVCTGGQTVQAKQLLENKPEVHNGIALDPDFRTLVGSQMTPYIYEDYASVESIADAFMKMYKMGPEKRSEIGQRGREYVLKHFSGEKVIGTWDRTIEDTIENWRKRRPPKWNMNVL